MRGKPKSLFHALACAPSLGVLERRFLYDEQRVLSPESYLLLYHASFDHEMAKSGEYFDFDYPNRIKLRSLRQKIRVSIKSRLPYLLIV